MAKKIVIECPGCGRPHSPILTLPIVYKDGVRFEMMFYCDRKQVTFWVDFLTMAVTR